VIEHETSIAISNLNMPDNLYLGEVAGFDLNSEGHMFVYTRTGEAGDLRYRRSAQLFEFDRNGTFVREIGGPNNYAMGWAHSVRIDREDNIWIVDGGTHLVAKFNRRGQQLMCLGRRPESVGVWGRADVPGEDRAPFGMMPEETGQFYEPTDVAFDNEGNIFVSDGYKNAQVQKFDRDGHFIKRWGKRGSAPGEFILPHSIATDRDGRVYVGDRGNNRVQIFDNDGNFISQIKLDIRLPRDTVFNTAGLPKGKNGIYNSYWPNAVVVSRGPNPTIYTNDTSPSTLIAFSLDGRIVGRFGEDGRKVGQFGWMHMLACTEDDDEVYVTELVNMRVSRVRIRRPK